MVWNGVLEPSLDASCILCHGCTFPVYNLEATFVLWNMSLVKLDKGDSI